MTTDHVIALGLPPSCTYKHHTIGPNVLIVEMQGLDIFDALCESQQEGQGGEREDGTGSSRDSDTPSPSSTADGF